MMNIIITHTPTNRTVKFTEGREAAKWLDKYITAKMDKNDLNIVSPVHLSVYEERVPDWAVTLFERVSQDYNLTIPRIHWLIKKNEFSTGRTWFKRYGSDEITHITISCGRNLSDAKGVVLHELAHALNSVGEHHGKNFYLTLFKLFRQYLTIGEERHSVKREEDYIKSSRFWYAELYNIQPVLAEYRWMETAVAAKKPTPEEKRKNVLDNLFKEI